jgi:hypothetical protein
MEGIVGNLIIKDVAYTRAKLFQKVGKRQFGLILFGYLRASVLPSGTEFSD